MTIEMINSQNCRNVNMKCTLILFTYRHMTLSYMILGIASNKYTISKSYSMSTGTNIHNLIDEFLDSIREDLHRVNEFLANLPQHPNNVIKDEIPLIKDTSRFG
jgi:hypothetical protein